MTHPLHHVPQYNQYRVSIDLPVGFLLLCVSTLVDSTERPACCVILIGLALLLACIKTLKTSDGHERSPTRHPTLGRPRRHLNTLKIFTVN